MSKSKSNNTSNTFNDDVNTLNIFFEIFYMNNSNTTQTLRSKYIIHDITFQTIGP